jgi:hypothetical protein
VTTVYICCGGKYGKKNGRGEQIGRPDVTKELSVEGRYQYGGILPLEIETIKCRLVVKLNTVAVKMK